MNTKQKIAHQRTRLIYAKDLLGKSTSLDTMMEVFLLIQASTIALADIEKELQQQET